MTSAFSWQNSVSLCPASLFTPRPNLPVTPGISWLPLNLELFLKKCKSLSFASFLEIETAKCVYQGVQFSSVAQSCPTLCDPMNHSTPGLPVHHQLPEFTQTHVHQVGDAIQPSRPLSSPSPPAPNLSQHQGLFQWVSSSHQVAKVLELQLQHQSFQSIFRVDFLCHNIDHLCYSLFSSLISK